MIEQRRRWLDQILIVLIALLPGISALSEPPIYAAKKEAANIRAMFDKIVQADRATVAFQQADASAAGGH